MVKNQKEPTLGDVKIFQKPNSNDFLVYKAIIFETDDEARDFLADIMKARQLSHSNILQLVSTCCKILKIFSYDRDDEINTFCAKNFVVEVLSSYDQFSLSYLMEKRKRYARGRFIQYFRDEEVWDMLVQILRACIFAKEFGIIFDDIQPFNLMMKAKEAIGVAGVKEEMEYSVRILNPTFFRKAKQTQKICHHLTDQHGLSQKNSRQRRYSDSQSRGTFCCKNWAKKPDLRPGKVLSLSDWNHYIKHDD